MATAFPDSPKSYPIHMYKKSFMERPLLKDKNQMKNNKLTEKINKE